MVTCLVFFFCLFVSFCVFFFFLMQHFCFLCSLTGRTFSPSHARSWWWHQAEAQGRCSGPAVLLLSARSVSETSSCLSGAAGLEHEHAAVTQSGNYPWSTVCKGMDPTAGEVSRVFSLAEGDSCLLLSCFIHLLIGGAGARAVLAKISSSPLF